MGGAKPRICQVESEREVWVLGAQGSRDARNQDGRGSADELSPIKRALLAIKDLQAQLDAVRREPIAIVGMSCRLPGKVESPERFWDFLLQKGDAIAPVPKDRWNISDYHDPSNKMPGKMVSDQGGFVPYLYDFDAAFFRISPREAISLDPQQRLALELAWEAFEHAGIAVDSLTESDKISTGVFLGISSIDHWQQMLSQPESRIDAYLATGNTHSVAAGRLSYLLGLTGPSLAIDTACSSSLISVHLACQSLRQGDCDVALAGGVNRMITPTASINFSKANMLAADGRCRTFDAAASGFGRAEGGGLVVLKRLSDARAAGDRIHAVILGSATNHNGRTNGLTAPSKTAQQAVIRQALERSQMAADQVGYVETHGTGTSLGDPIEVGALGAVFGDVERASPLVLGAVKTNIGHAEAAAGIAGLIKAALVVEKGQIPANLHLNSPNVHVDWDELPFVLPNERVDWTVSEKEGTVKERTAGVSAFGFSGTNAHVVIQSVAGKEGKVKEEKVKEEKAKGIAREEAEVRLLPLSAKSSVALTQIAARYAQFLSNNPEVDLGDVCFTASVGRSHFSYRLVIVAASVVELRQSLVDVLAGRETANCWRSNELATDAITTKDAIRDLGNADSPSLEPFRARIQTKVRQYLRGENVDWQALYSTGTYGKLALPTYPFQRQYYGPQRRSLD